MDPVKRWEDEDAAHQRMLAARPGGRKCGLSPTTCHTCGSVDGMQHWDPEVVAQLEERILVGFWSHHADPSHVFDPCPVCNRGGVVPEGYEALTAPEVIKWAEAEVEAYGEKMGSDW